MDSPDLIGLFVRPLEELGVPYMVTGVVASVIYGDPRFTRDIDIVLKLDPAETVRFAAAFDPKRYHVPPPEALRREAGRLRHGHFNVIHGDTGLRADVYLLDRGELQQWGFGRKLRLALEATAISVAPPEYVIVSKLQYYRDSGSDRHLRDIAMMLRLSAERIDRGEIAGWVSRLGLDTEWAAAQRFDPA